MVAPNPCHTEDCTNKSEQKRDEEVREERSRAYSISGCARNVKSEEDEIVSCIHHLLQIRLASTINVIFQKSKTKQNKTKQNKTKQNKTNKVEQTTMKRGIHMAFTGPLGQRGAEPVVEVDPVVAVEVVADAVVAVVAVVACVAVDVVDVVEAQGT